MRARGAADERRYQFPGGVLVSLRASQRDILRHFDGEYHSLITEADGPPHIEVFAGREISGDLCAAWDVPPHSGRHKTIRWKVALDGFDSTTTKVAYEGAGAMAVSFLQTFYLEPLLRLKFLQVDHALVHGASLIKGDRCVLFPGGSRVGKTTLTLLHAISGNRIQGDNYVIVTSGGEALAFPRRLRIYSDISSTNPRAYERLPARERLRLRMAGLIKSLSFGFANMPRRLRIDEFAPGCLLPRAKIESVYALAPSNGETLSEPQPLTMALLLDRIQEQSRLEAERLAPIIAPYLAAQPESWLHRADSSERHILTRALSGLPAFHLEVPRVSDPEPLVRQIARVAGLEAGDTRRAVST